ncbi:MAG: glycosyltransferase [Candidatus Sungiibacteriota bacterium]
MRILVIGTDATIFQKNSDARHRTEEYARLFDEYHMIIYSRPGFQQEAVPPLFIYPTNSLFYFFRPFDAFRIGRQIIHRSGIGLVSVQDPAESGIAGWLLKKTYGIKLHIQIHADFFSPFFRKNSWKELVRYWLARFIIPRGDKFRVVSRRVADSLNSEFGIRHSAVSLLPIFVDRERIAGIRPSFGLRQKYPEFDFIIIMVSRLVREKNISLALLAFRDFLKEFPKSGLIIVGDGPGRERLKLENSVRLEGWQNDLVSYYKGADLYFLTSNFEGYSRSVVEAAAAGCPVVMTDVGVAGEVIQDGKTGRVVKVGDKNALVRALCEARRHYDDSRRMAEGAKELVLAAPPRTWQDYLKLYKDSFGF